MKRPLAALCVPLLVGAFLAVIASASPAAQPQPSPTDRAAQAVSAHPSDARSAPGDTYHVKRSKVDPDGAAHVRYARTYKGLRVYGGDFVVHTKADGTYAGMSVGLNRPLTLSTTPGVAAASAVNVAKAAFLDMGGTITATGKPELFIDATSGEGLLAYETVVRGWARDGQTPSVLHVITDAITGKLVGSFDEIVMVEGTGNSIYSGTVPIDTTLSGSTYSMVDPSHGNGLTCDLNNGTSTCTTFTDADNLWGNGSQSNDQSAAADAHHGAATTFDYFLKVHGRNGIFGDGRGVPSRVHYGSNYVNAFWDGAQMTYGDGAGNARPLVSIDVAGHEMAHGVTEALAGLVYSGESGGLNEATSDIFGNMVEFYANNAADPGDYQVGEKIDINGDGTPLRYMYDPSLDGQSHSCWSTSTGSVDVHYSSGVANHFYFNLAEGSGATPYGTSPVCGSAPAVTGIGRASAERIWYRALDVYFTSTTRYVNPANPANTARAYTLSAAADLFGVCSTEYAAVQKAWTAVNVAGTDERCPSGNDFSLAASPNAGTLDPGGSVTSTITSTLTHGSAQTVELTAGGLPPGANATFSPSSVNSDGGATTMTISTTANTPTGTYEVTITGTGPGSIRDTSFSLTVNGPPGCSQGNGTRVEIPDQSTVESTITISGCEGNAASNSTVEVHIAHTYIGDLVVSLVSPDGTSFVLHNRAGGSADAINQTYTVDLSSEAANGTWRLRVQDASPADSGTIDLWGMNLGGSGPSPGCSGSNPDNVTIPVNSTVSSAIAVSGCSGNASSTSTVEVHIAHTRIGSLVVSLVAPDGTSYTLHNQKGGNADDINQTYTVNLSGEARNGTWTLRVQNSSARDTGSIDSWTLTL